ncbi:MAG: MaoC/PaaZ C-terminal domain-containing protein [Deltaproteobacteria bacterium]|jgi:acyl dehydratase|nr:MaoC/PaaZ C-terminal domain-containing protein [Deltaproteobacteria bacterium]
MVSEGIVAGTKIRSRVNRTLDKGDFSLLHSFCWFTLPVHCDAEYAKGTWFAERSLAAPIIFVIADGLVHCGDQVNELLEKHGYSIAAYVGVENVKFTKPVLFGDTLRAEAEVTEFRPTKNPKRSLFSYTNKTYNQRNELVVEYTSSILVEKQGQ